MKEVVISFETAKLAKEKGFNWNCNDFYNQRGMLFSNGWCENIYDRFQEPFEISNKALENAKLTYITAPTQSLAQKWLREVHNIHFIVSTGLYPESKKRFYQIQMFIYNWMNVGTLFKTYEEALEAGIKEALKLIKHETKESN